MFKLDFEKAEEPEMKLPTSVGLQKKQGNSRKTSTSALLISPMPLTGFSSVQFSHSVVSNSFFIPWPTAHQDQCKLENSSRDLMPDDLRWS